MATFTWRPPSREGTADRSPTPDPAPPPGRLRMAVKDIIDMAGVVTTAGSRVLADTAPPAAADAACLAGVRAAESQGRLEIVGRTNLHELAFGITGVNPWFGTPVNPLDPARVPGGSSSGSAVAVARREDGPPDADVALGTDTGGSIRIPAACCGVAGLKTSRDRVPLAGVRPLGPSLDTVGPMAADVAGVVAAMALLEPGFPAHPGRPARRIGRFRPPAGRLVDEALDAALGRLAASAGIEILELDLPGWADATHAVMTILSAEAWEVNGYLHRDHAERLSPDVSARLAAASQLDPEEVAAARLAARRWDDEVASVFSRVDLVAMPVLADAPPVVADAARMAELRHTAPWNLCGSPALAQPLPGVTGWPPSLQLVGPPGEDEVVLSTGLLVEEATRGG